MIKKAQQRRWSARAWWTAFHVYVYAILLYSGSFTLERMTWEELVVVVLVAVGNVASYITLQRSSPGFLSSASDGNDLEAGKTAAEETASDRECLVQPKPVQRSSNDSSLQSPLHFCDICNLQQPLRAKHCKDCGSCVLQYDHHCDCAGTCVGERNRHKFLFYLGTQLTEGFLMIGVASDAFSDQKTVDEWFKVNAPYIIAWLSIFSILLLVLPLFLYQVYLISTNQTSWEHARRRSITYLQILPDDHLPFDRGCLNNWWIFLSGGDTNKWIHAPAQRHTAPGSPDASSIM